jgi:hypothetical protein
MLLGHHGVPSLSVERHAGTAIHPRAGHFQLRTMELLRQLGLEERVRAKSLETYSPTGGIIAVESLAGRELATYVKELNEGVEGFSPTVRVCSVTASRRDLASSVCATDRLELREIPRLAIIPPEDLDVALLVGRRCSSELDSRRAGPHNARCPDVRPGRIEHVRAETGP